MNYIKYSDKEILESYTTALDYSGKVDKDLIAEIDRRGGVEQLKTNVSKQMIVPDEIKRINRLVFSFYKENLNPDQIKSSIKSEILSYEQLNASIDLAIKNIEREVKDTAINSKTIIGSIIGVFVSSLLGAGLWCYSINQTGKMYYILTPGIFLFSYSIIRLLTRQTKNNVLIFIATFVSTFIAIPLGIWFYKILVG